MPSRMLTTGLPPIERLEELFTLDMESGWLVRRAAPIKHHSSLIFKAGTRAGAVNAQGYRNVRIDGRLYAEHRVVFAMMTGAWPQDEIDHINGQPGDNRPENLRLSTRKMNAQNRRRPLATNKLGVLGVKRYFDKYHATLHVGKRAMFLGSYDTPEEAHAAYVAAKRKHHEGCTL